MQNNLSPGFSADKKRKRKNNQLMTVTFYSTFIFHYQTKNPGFPGSFIHITEQPLDYPKEIKKEKIICAFVFHIESKSKHNLEIIQIIR
jgi:hypothetical protein